MISVALPEIVIFSLVAIISYIQLQELFHDLSREKVDNLQSELESIIKFQDVSLSQISRNLDKEAQSDMKAIRYKYFLTSDSIETADLAKIRAEIGMKESNDIYIINNKGVIINTTFEDDLGMDLFSLSTDFKSFLQDVIENDFYTPQPLNLENSTRRFKKYIYQSSKDHNYIIQLGYYSSEASRFNKEISKRLDEIVKSPNDIKSIDLILAPWNPFSLYSGEEIEDDEVELIQSIFKNKANLSEENESGKISYIYFDRTDGGSISWTGILKVVYDREREKEVLILNLVQKISLFGVGMILLFIILFFNVRSIIRPIQTLSSTARKLGEGDLDQRAHSEGSREMVFLSDSFNYMAEKLEKSHQEITKKNEEILSSINYAKRIQEAIMPPSDVLKGSLKEYFILYEPKDIVAGDFYWFEENENYIFIAAADCTGHGVPGAMVSVVCSNALNKAVKEMELHEPAEILNKVRDLVIATFERSQHDVKDGMDICFCRIDKKSREVAYAGAQNSLYRICDKDKLADHEHKVLENDSHILIDYKGDKQPIGKYAVQRDFNQTLIPCKTGDMLYLFTDGFADQFGGTEGKKFMYKPFKRLLLKISQKEMKDQESELLSTFTNWRGKEDQIDDVCIIGIRIQ